ncbi:FixH family protein [Zoogloea sp.]|uniref:FixH family protein n=1 Tax=Zoogloea sp. TaxID=49181 RepID=UPI002602D23F|nr:FixH family protein [Zoogloea sp.]MDD3354739.1 FixH family protein [Zoogloea sp.]
MNTSAHAKHNPNPWYKERWTWLLMLMPATAIVAGGITLWLAIKSFDGLVADDYYKQGLAINQTLAKANAAAELGLTAKVKFAAEALQVELASQGGSSLPERLLVTLAHPTRGGLDQQLVMERSGPVYRAAIPMALGTAHWKILLEDESRSWRLTGTAFLPTETEIRIDSSDLKPVD